MTSPGVPSTTVPNSSAATTFIIERAKRCVLMAMAAPSISFEVATTNLSSFTASPAATAPWLPPAVSVMSCCEIFPAVTATELVCDNRPVKKTFTRAEPSGTLVRRYWPLSSENVSKLVPSIVTRARSRYSSRPVSKTRPSIVPVVGVCARPTTASSMATAIVRRAQREDNEVSFVFVAFEVMVETRRRAGRNRGGGW